MRKKLIFVTFFGKTFHSYTDDIYFDATGLTSFEVFFKKAILI